MMVMVGGIGTVDVAVVGEELPRVPKTMPTAATAPTAAQMRQSLYKGFFFTASSSGVRIEFVCEMVTLPVRVPIVAVTVMSKGPAMAFIRKGARICPCKFVRPENELF